jgi:hypothetical protein
MGECRFSCAAGPELALSQTPWFGRLDGMSSSSAYLGLYWGARLVTLEEATSLVVKAFEQLDQAGYRNYFRKGKSRKAALREPVNPNLETVKDLLLKGRNKTDVGGQVIPELGFSLALWSGGPDTESYSVTVHLGCYSKWVGNSFLLNLPAVGPLSRAQNEERLLVLKSHLQELFSPDTTRFE